MKIRTQFIVSTLIFALTLLIVATSVIINDRQVERTNQQEAIARRLEREANELSYLSTAYLLYQESQQFARWESKLASFSHNLMSLHPDSPEQQAVVNNIKANLERLQVVFTEASTTLESASRAPGGAPDPAFIQLSWSRMEVQNQGMIFDASRLAQMLRDQANELKRTNTLLMFVLIGLLGAFLLVNYVLTYRHTLRSMSDLQAGTRIIGAGNLDFAIAERGRDEIGELSRAFNRMTASLKEVTASKADLEREIAERKKAEEEIRQLNQNLAHRAADLDAANKELEAFSYSVSHDLRAPLRHIDGFSHILLQDYADRLDEQGKQYLQFLRDGSQSMERLIDAMLRLSRVTRVEMQRQPVNLSELAESILAEWRREQPERQVESTVTPGVMAQGDPQLLRLMLENLLGNAWKFTSQRPVARIEFGVRQPDGNPLYYVQDNGAGFDMAYADRLFGAFQRLHKAEDYPGTGVGLATVQRIIHRHGGRVWAEGAVDQGAAFYFTLA